MTCIGEIKLESIHYEAKNYKPNSAESRFKRIC